MLWFFVLTPVLASALSANTEVFNDSSYSFFVNNSSSGDMATSGYTSGAGIIEAYTNFHFNIWWIDVLMVSVGAVFGAWVLVTVFGGVGG